MGLGIAGRAPPDGPLRRRVRARARAPTVDPEQAACRGRAAAATPRRSAACREALAREGLQNPLAEVQQQNQELLRALDELRRRQEDLVRLNRELEDTNRGVVALYAELDEKAEHLRRADEMKSRFLSNMSHEFRTPLNSILAIARLLQERTDGDLTRRAGEAGRVHPARRPRT